MVDGLSGGGDRLGRLEGGGARAYFAAILACALWPWGAGANCAGSGPETEWRIHWIQSREHAVHSARGEGGENAPPIPRAKASASGLSKRVVGWHPWWVGTAYQRYDYAKLDTIAYFSFEVNSTNGNPASLRGWDATPVIAWGHSNGVKVVLTATLFGATETQRLLSNAASRSNLIHQLAVAVSNRNGDGVNIDFEDVGTSMRSNLTGFMSNLTARFHRDLPGSEVSIALPAVDWDNAYDAATMGGFLDYMIVMGYDFHWQTAAEAGPVAPLAASTTWGAYSVERSITNYLGMGVSPGKLLLGCPYYGYDWPTASAAIPSAAETGAAITYSEAMLLAAVHGRQWNAEASAPYCVYTNAGKVHQAWYDDAESLGMKYDLANAKGLGGIGIWALGYDDGRPELWALIGEKFGWPRIDSLSSTTDGGGVAFRWASATGEVFSLWVSSNLLAGLEGFGLAESGIVARPPQNVHTAVAPTSTGTYYYQLRGERAESP